jgi:hypothetical protein
MPTGFAQVFHRRRFAPKRLLFRCVDGFVRKLQRQKRNHLKLLRNVTTIDPFGRKGFDGKRGGWEPHLTLLGIPMVV